MFRSADDGVDMVVATSSGFGYIPSGVYIPRTARVIGADPLVDKAFRDRWFGWADPAHILVEYGRLRPAGWRLTAVATTRDASEPVHGPGIDYRLVPRPDGGATAPVLDADHQHRLELEHRDVYERLAPLMEPEVEGWARERLAVPLAQATMHDLAAGGVDCPQELRTVWTSLMSGQGAPTLAEWGAFCAEAGAADLRPDCARPLGDPLPEPGRRPYEPYWTPWQQARAMEVVLGWYSKDGPVKMLPVPDMAYAAAAAGVDIRAVLAEPLALVEAQLR